MKLPHPNVEVKPGQEVTPQLLTELSKKLQENLDFIAARLK